jgi:hypothetical protein
MIRMPNFPLSQHTVHGAPIWNQSDPVHADNALYAALAAELVSSIEELGGVVSGGRLIIKDFASKSVKFTFTFCTKLFPILFSCLCCEQKFNVFLVVDVLQIDVLFSLFSLSTFCMCSELLPE